MAIHQISNVQLVAVYPIEEMKASPDVNEALTSSKHFNLEHRLSSEISSIEAPRKWHWKKAVNLAICSIYEEGIRRPWTTLAQGIIATVGLSAIYPNAVGSWACLKTFDVVPLSDMESSNLETAMVAAQGIGNTGMAVTYMVQLYELIFHPIFHRFISEPYNRRICHEITKAYNLAIIKANSPCEKEFLVQRTNRELLRYGGLPLSKNINIDEIQQQINRDLKHRLRKKNIIYLTARQIKQDINTSSWEQFSAKTAKTVVIVGLVGICSAILSIGTYGCFKPFDLQNPSELESSDPHKVENAVANYANAGHGLEYVAVMGMLGFKGIQSIIGNQYKKVIHQQIHQSYMSHLVKEELSSEESNLLFQRMQQTFSQHNC